MIDDKTDERQEVLRWEYEEASKNFRALAETRFKLLALIPPLGGVAIYLLGNLSSVGDAGTLLLLAMISLLGFVATLGITFYDQRNSELYDALIGRAKFLERELELTANPLARVSDPGGQFRERPGRGKKLFGLVRMGHDTGLALIYGVVLGAWFFPMVVAALRGFGYRDKSEYLIGLVSALVMVIAFVCALVLLDPGIRRKRGSEKERSVADRSEDAG